MPGKRTRKTARATVFGTAALYGFTDPLVVKGLAYCDDVVAGKIAACKYVQQACARQIGDLARARAGEFPYEFDEGLAGRAARFLEQLPHIQGPLAGTLIALEGWQCWIQTTVYGWVRRGTKLPRFRRIYEEVPRGNGKSIHLSGNTLYSFAQGEEGAEITPAAVDREQSRKVYDVAVAMLRKRPALREKLGLEVSSKAMAQVSTNSTCYPLSREAKKNGDGKNIFFAPVDELHAHRTRDVYDVLDTGTGKRATSRIWVITTAGFDTSGICYEKRSTAIKVLAGVVEDESLFAVIYTIDDGDDWTDAACREACSDHSHPWCVWRKANPNWGVSVEVNDFEMKMRTAMQVASAQTEILTKHLNIWCNSSRPFITPRDWAACGDPQWKREDFAGEPCWIGLDLGSTSDLTAKVLLFARDQDDGRHFYAFADCYLPETAVSDARNSQYHGWEQQGLIITTTGNVTDYRVVGDAIRLDAETYRPKEIPFDPWNSASLVSDLLEDGLPMVKFDVNVKNFSPAMKELDILVRSGRFHHDGNPLVAWCMSNVVCKEDNKGNLFPRKERPENKIDPIMALLSALGRATATAEPKAGGSYLDGEEVLCV